MTRGREGGEGEGRENRGELIGEAGRVSEVREMKGSGEVLYGGCLE